MSLPQKGSWVREKIPLFQRNVGLVNLDGSEIYTCDGAKTFDN